MEKPSNSLDGLEDNSHKSLEYITGDGEIFDSSSSKKLARSELISKLRLQGESFSITSPNISIGYQLDTVMDNLVKYEAERLKFLNIVDNIDKDRELFYDPKAKILFLQYLDLLPHLIEDLRLREFTLLSNLPALPEQTQEEIDSLSPQGVALPEQTQEEIDSLSPQGVALPEQTQEEITTLSEQDGQISKSPSSEKKSSLKAEDFMEDALKNLGMFSEKD